MKMKIGEEQDSVSGEGYLSGEKSQKNKKTD